MEQSKFILEVQSKQCLWNPRVPEYLDRFIKRQAWEEIAAKMYRGYERCSDSEKIEKVRELQKKWKSLRDFYKRRNTKEDIDEETQKKRPIVELLQFLDKVIIFNQQKRAQRLAEQMKKIKNKNLIFKLPDYKITVQKCNENQSPKPRNTKTISFLCPKHSAENEPQQSDEMKFLQSLLPVMLKLNDRQRFEFKLQVMMLVKKIKYEHGKDTPSSTDVSHRDNSLSHRPAVIESPPRSMPSSTTS